MTNTNAVSKSSARTTVTRLGVGLVAAGALTGLLAAEASAATTKTPPATPTITSVARAGDGAATIAVVPGIGPIATSVRVTASPGGKGCTVKIPAAVDCKISGLTNGTSYSFTAVASGSGGASGVSPPSDALTVGRRPFKVTKLTAVASVGGEATLSWVPGASGGLPITGYTVTGSSETLNCTTTDTTCRFTGLTPGVKYRWAVVASNDAGQSDAALSNNLTAIGARRPDSPTVGTATRVGDGKVRVTVQPGNPNGGAISRIVVRTDALRADGTFTRMATVSCVITPPGDGCVITGLKNGGTYRFLAEATNVAGTSPLGETSSPYLLG